MLSDSAYPTTLWQVKPSSFSLNLTECEKPFNKQLSSVRVLVEQPFGVLKGRSRILLKRTDIGLENTVKVTCRVKTNTTWTTKKTTSFHYFSQKFKTDSPQGHERYMKFFELEMICVFKF